MPLDARELSNRVSPALIAQIEAKKEELMAEMGGPIARAIVRAAWPRLIRQIPTLTEAGIEALAQEFGHLTIEDLASTLVSIRQTAALRRSSP